MFDIVYADASEYEVCPFCGYYEGSAPMEPYHLRPGTELYRRYAIGNVIGYGGFGITYKAWDNVLETVVAIKEYYPTGLVQRVPGQCEVIIYTGESRDEYVQGLTRFLDEAKNMARFIDNPNIVHVDAYFEENNTAYLVMEYLDGVTLKEHLKLSGGIIPCDMAVSIAEAIGVALADMHSGGIIHRDISPANIMLCSRGRIKLIDFGAARFADTDNERTRSIVLKPGFAPPEQYQEKSVQGPWTDVYALAATMYRSMTGRLPVESVNRVIHDELESPMSINPNIPEYISNAIMKGMALDVEMRFKTAAELIEALVGERKAYDPRVELKRRKIIRIITISMATAALLCMCVVVWFMYRDKKEEAVLNAADITVWIAVDDGLDSEGAAEMMDSAVETFLKDQETVKVEFQYVPESQYAQKLEEAYAGKRMPTIYMSEYASDDIKADAAAVDKVFDNLDEDSCYLLSDYEKEIEASKEIPLSFRAPVLYVKRSSSISDIDSLTISDYTQISGLEDDEYYISPDCVDMLLASFGQNTEANAALYESKESGSWKDCADDGIYKVFADSADMLYYYSTTDEYSEVGEKLAGRYKVARLGTDNIYVEFSNEISISGSASRDERNAAIALVGYLLQQNAQESMFLGTTYTADEAGTDGSKAASQRLARKVGLPLNKDAFDSYTKTNTEMTLLDDYAKKMVVDID